LHRILKPRITALLLLKAVVQGVKAREAIIDEEREDCGYDGER
jgi:hypothetical protein